MKYKTADDRLIRVGDAYEYWKNKADTVTKWNQAKMLRNMLDEVPSAKPEIIFCKDCKFYNPMNYETKTGICNLTMHQNFGDNWFCAGAERRSTNE